MDMMSWGWGWRMGAETTQKEEIFDFDQASEDTTITTHSRGGAEDRVDEQYRMHIHNLQD